LDVFIIGLASGLTVALLLWIFKIQSHFFKNLFDEESRRQAKQINGEWKASETFADGTIDSFKLELKCIGGKVDGRQDCLTGHDEGKSYRIEGTYKDHILNFTWIPLNEQSIESGTVTARLIKDHNLDGHGLYIEPDDGKVYTSKFMAEK
jgi:hypothetical protein